MAFSVGNTVWKYLSAHYPAKTLLHVGAGGKDPSSFYADINPGKVLIVEADEQNCTRLQRIFRNPNTHKVSHMTLGSTPEETVFYHASNRNESGLMCPEVMSTLWQNLKTLGEDVVHVSTIKTLFKGWGKELGAESVNWVSIDCFPGLDILQGAEEFIECWDVVIARALLCPRHTPNLGGQSKEALDNFMKANGYSFLTLQREHQPLIGRAVYVRDWRSVLDEKLNRCLEKSRNNNKEHSRVMQAQAATIANRDQKLHSLETQRVKLAAELDELNDFVLQQKKQQSDLRGELNAIIEDRNKWRNQQQQLALVHEQYEKQLEEYSALHDQLRAVTDDRNKCRGQIREMEAARAQYNKQIEKLGATEKLVEDERQRRILSENNHRNLRKKYKALTEEYNTLTAVLSNVCSKLKDAIDNIETDTVSNKRSTRKRKEDGK